MNYILIDKQPVPCPDIATWASFMSTGNRQVALTNLGQGVRVSTVFLGIDHSFGGDTPILFETMVFAGEHDQWQHRWATWEEAEAGHKEVVRDLIAGLLPDQ